MHLTSEDERYLRSRQLAARRLERIWQITLVMDAVIAVAAFFLLEPPVNYVIAVVMLMSGVVVLFVMRMTTARMGDPQPILDGRDPTAWMEVVAVGAEGNPPLAWSFEIPAEPGRYVHAGEPGVSDWRFETGQTYQLHGFGPADKPYEGIVYFTRTHHGGRYWDHNVRLSNERWNTATQD